MWGGGYNGFALSRPSVSIIVSALQILYQLKNFLQTWWNVNLKLAMCQLKVKVTIEFQISNNQILDIMSCPLCKSYTNWNIFFNLGSNVHLNKGMCRTHVTLLPA